jgi:single-strand DNA-binding protein
LNVASLIGRFTRDPELRTTTTGKSVCSFSIAVPKRIKPSDGSPDAEFVNCVAWGQQAEYVTNYLTKGRLVAVVGRIQTRSYTASDGSRREVFEIVAESVQGLDRAKDDRQPVASGAPAVDEYDPFADE